LFEKRRRIEVKAKLFVVSAPSGAGKNSLIEQVLKIRPDLVYSISATTRPPRNNEKEGVDYFFKTEAEFQEMIRKEQLVEFEKVHGHYYGTPKSFIQDMLEQGKNVIMDIDVKGKLKIDKVYPQAIGIFIITRNMEDLRKRLLGRGSESSDTIDLRIENAEKEIEMAKSIGKYEYTVINDDLSMASREFIDIISENI
jgi:guanylate kinase